MRWFNNLLVYCAEKGERKKTGKTRNWESPFKREQVCQVNLVRAWRQRNYCSPCRAVRKMALGKNNWINTPTVLAWMEEKKKRWFMHGRVYKLACLRASLLANRTPGKNRQMINWHCWTLNKGSLPVIWDYRLQAKISPDVFHPFLLIYLVLTPTISSKR